MKTCEAIDMPASPAAQLSLCTAQHSTSPLFCQGRLSLMITSVSLKKKVLPKVSYISH